MKKQKRKKRKEASIQRVSEGGDIDGDRKRLTRLHVVEEDLPGYPSIISIIKRIEFCLEKR